MALLTTKEVENAALALLAVAPFTNFDGWNNPDILAAGVCLMAKALGAEMQLPERREAMAVTVKDAAGQEVTR